MAYCQKDDEKRQKNKKNKSSKRICFKEKIPGCPAAPERRATTSEEHAVSQVTHDISMRDSTSTLFTKELKIDVCVLG